MKTVAATGALAAATAAGFAKAAGPLTWQCFPAGENGFYRAPVLISGGAEAVLIDGGFTYPDGLKVVEAIRASGRTLTTIYVSQSDPDYYFSLKPITAAFPKARVIAASATVAAIRASVEKKLAVWGPQLKENGPQSLADIVYPESFDGPTLQVDGEVIEILAADGLANRRTLYVPALNAMVGGVLVFSGVHVWTADTPTPAQRAEWRANLEKLAARKPAIVVPGHMAATAATDSSAIAFTLAYLTAFDEELPRAANAAALKSAMEARFPGLGMGVAIDIGSKVATGEMKWG
ncbi:glyoxylase-like metal-dependent hydrolase (beta-lactamase superfamily II) [Novosphingobium sp. SG751A]|uniref:MBL fold metallo-hydrolase n=1 Tax=Novosphingobium sp. SG751A TaxID=2587000 RepID=UPI001C12C586|nr:MBL fold metallo-hydrolase [Novosphingobium sp. SG751A]NOW48909.1 glyoxylase-like metal-dependent hydrolase (beta-lactamase superfamily II) [Novosphingobium sp. SG751A]